MKASAGSIGLAVPLLVVAVIIVTIVAAYYRFQVKRRRAQACINLSPASNNNNNDASEMFDDGESADADSEQGLLPLIKNSVLKIKE